MPALRNGVESMVNAGFLLAPGLQLCEREGNCWQRRERGMEGRERGESCLLWETRRGAELALKDRIPKSLPEPNSRSALEISSNH